MVVKAHIVIFFVRRGGGSAGKNTTLTIVLKQCFELSYPRQWLCTHRVGVSSTFLITGDNEILSHFTISLINIANCL